MNSAFLTFLIFTYFCDENISHEIFTIPLDFIVNSVYFVISCRIVQFNKVSGAPEIPFQGV
jgi:hypothetical protein